MLDAEVTHGGHVFEHDFHLLAGAISKVVPREVKFFNRLAAEVLVQHSE